MPQAPKATGSDVLARLRAPFEPSALRFKVQATNRGENVLVVAYIDARLVVERLNLVVGLDWHDEYIDVPSRQDAIECRLTVLGVTRCDVGVFDKDKDTGGRKAVVSDALKRAGVKFGIGVSVYAMPKLWIGRNMCRESDGKVRGLLDSGEAHCRQRYRGWLERAGAAAFGEPIPHGDAEDAVGDAELESQYQEERPPAERQQARSTRRGAPDPDDPISANDRRQIFAAKSRLKLDDLTLRRIVRCATGTASTASMTHRQMAMVMAGIRGMENDADATMDKIVAWETQEGVTPESATDRPTTTEEASNGSYEGE